MVTITPPTPEREPERAPGVRHELGSRPTSTSTTGEHDHDQPESEPESEPEQEQKPERTARSSPGAPSGEVGPSQGWLGASQARREATLHYDVEPTHKPWADYDAVVAALAGLTV